MLGLIIAMVISLAAIGIAVYSAIYAHVCHSEMEYLKGRVDSISARCFELENSTSLDLEPLFPNTITIPKAIPLQHAVRALAARMGLEFREAAPAKEFELTEVDVRVD